MLLKISQFFKSFNFIKGVMLTTSAIVAIVVCHYVATDAIGISIAFGVLLASPGDIPGNKKHHLNGILMAIALAIITTMVINLTHASYFILFPVLALLVFFNAIISVYGFRASLVSFSGLLAISLSFAHLKTGTDILLSALYIAIGGLWYLLVSSTFNFLRPKQFSEQLLTECMQLTADYLQIRASLVINNDRNNLLKQLLDLQTLINDKHEALRSILLNSRSKSGATNYLERQLLIFIDLVDVLELAIANQVSYDAIDKDFKGHKETIEEFVVLIEALSKELHRLSYQISGHKNNRPSMDLDKLLLKIDDAISAYKKAVDLNKDRKNILMLRNLYDYEEKQVQKIKNIQRLISNNYKSEGKDFEKTVEKKFITREDYDLKTLKEHLTLKSPIFKHSLRLTVTVLIGFLIGNYFSIQNAYWIILTIIVIMRPNYGLTKERSKQRIIGTLIGGVIAASIVVLTQNVYVYTGITIISMVLAFSFVQQNYKASAIFITLNIVFVYALLQPNAFEVIQFRIVDTLIGASLAIVANHTLWPAWEFYNVKGFILASIEANKKYLEEVCLLYNDKTEIKTSYKLSRKEAFIAIGNLNAAFQRMAQEPKSKQKDFLNLYEIVVIQHTFLSSTAAMGTYIQAHKTTEASKDFNTYAQGIINVLDSSILILNNTLIGNNRDDVHLEEAIKNIKLSYATLHERRNAELASGQLEISKEMRLNLQEAHLLTDQLHYLYSLANNLKNSIAGYLKNNA